MPGALDDIRVVDMSEYIAGPYCGVLLSDFGADVIRVEPVGGAAWRSYQPVGPKEGRAFMACNRGKRSICVDYERAEGRRILDELLGTADVLITNFRVGAAERHRLDYAALHARFPRLIYVHNTANGRHGPDAARAGFDVVAQAMSGLMGLEPPCPEGALPRSLPLTLVDQTAACLLLGGICAALYARTRSGHGQYVETSLLAAALSLQTMNSASVEDVDGVLRAGWLATLAEARAEGLSFKEIAAVRRDALGPSQSTSGREESPYRGIVETSDGLIAYSCANLRLRRSFATLLDLADPMLDGTPIEHDEAWEITHRLADHVRTVMRSGSSAEWLARLTEAGIPAGPVRFPEELYEDPGVIANGYVASFNHPIAGELKLFGPLVALSETETAAQLPPPAAGQHTVELLESLGYSQRRIQELLEGGAVSHHA